MLVLHVYVALSHVRWLREHLHYPTYLLRAYGFSYCLS